MKCPEIIIKNRTWYTHDFNEAVGNNIGNSFHLMMLLLLVSKPKRGTNIKDEVRVKSNQIYELITDRSIRCLPSK